MCNNIPYGKSVENLYIRPGDFLYPDCSYEELPLTVSHLEGVSYMLSRIKLHKEKLGQIRYDILKTEWDRYKLGEKNTGNTKRHVAPTMVTW